MAHKKYLRILIASFCITLLPILALNLILINNSLQGHDNTRLASQWQHKTHGIVSAPSVLENGYFKLLRLQDRIQGINTVVFGASTSYAIEQNMFPESMRIYNFSKNGVGLNTMIAESEYLLKHNPDVKWFVIPLDWSIGFIYQNDALSVLDLSSDISQNEPQQPPLLQKIRDSLSYPRIEGLFRLLKTFFIAEQKIAAFRQIFLQPSSDSYRCADGIIAKDFDIQSRGNCRGFRDDGSWTFSGMDRVSNAHQTIMLATAFNSQYTKNLIKFKGIPNNLYLEHLADLTHRAEKRGGGAIFLMPPLLTGMEVQFTRDPRWQDYLAATKESLYKWAKRENVVLVDAGQSEKFDCHADDFTDAHHATQNCYRKVFSTFWQNASKPDGTPLLRSIH